MDGCEGPLNFHTLDQPQSMLSTISAGLIKRFADLDENCPVGEAVQHQVSTVLETKERRRMFAKVCSLR